MGGTCWLGRDCPSGERTKLVGWFGTCTCAPPRRPRVRPPPSLFTRSRSKLATTLHCTTPTGLSGVKLARSPPTLELTQRASTGGGRPPEGGGIRRCSRPRREGRRGGSTSLCRLTLRFLNLRSLHKEAEAEQVSELSEIPIS